MVHHDHPSLKMQANLISINEFKWITEKHNYLTLFFAKLSFCTPGLKVNRLYLKLSST